MIQTHSRFFKSAAGRYIVCCAAVSLYGNTNFSYEEYEEDLVNWSGTHSCKGNVLRPESVAEAEEIIKDFHVRKKKIRCVASGLSPNGVGFNNNESMLNMAYCDRVLHVDKCKKQVTVESGILVGTLLEELKQHGLTLQNLSSIKEQQIGGWIQTGCHGTGVTLPPVDDQVVAMKLITPARGAIDLSETIDNKSFSLAKCGLGALGVVAVVTLQCVPRHKLVETTKIMSVHELRENHTKLLRYNRHVRYMWIPNTDCVVVVTCNPFNETAVKNQDLKLPVHTQVALRPFRALYEAKLEEYKDLKTCPDQENWSFGLYRDKLLELDPLNPDHVAQVNRAEAEFWKLSEGTRVGYSDEILGFECGGQQLVLEGAFPSGVDPNTANMNDIDFVELLLKETQQRHIPTPSPIEQRWSASSASSMNPASRYHFGGFYSWVGIINYLCTADLEKRRAITEAFNEYSKLLYDILQRYDGAVHWAKLELPEESQDVERLRKRIREYFPVEEFNRARNLLDPHKILSNEFISKIFDE